MYYGAVLRYPGSKWKIAPEIIKIMPKHKGYLEPYFGSGAVFFNKTPSIRETINDRDNQVVNLFKVIRDFPDELAERIKLTPYSREEYMRSFEQTDSEIEKARRFLVRAWQAYGPRTSGSNSGWGRTKKITGPNRPQQWSKVPNFIYAFTERLKNTQIENSDAIELIKEYDYPEILIYLDPPYLKESRTHSGNLYKYEYKTEDHIKLLKTINEIKNAKIMLSGYENELYESELKDWNKEEFKSYALGGSFRKEVVYCNFGIKSKLF